MIADDIDVVYIALTADAHCERALEAIAAGRHVLLEKPFALNGDEAARMAGAARAAGVLAMEAMWTRYLPRSDAIRVLVADGTQPPATRSLLTVSPRCQRWEGERATTDVSSAAVFGSTDRSRRGRRVAS